ncbi:hypothetical protein Y032_0044g1054 [Ancylostoma ceylanicum]|uniref:UBX domain-containing protein n=1 Tax=Ancylostoma ceylanicum TaxID=53326 RepID=A0A016UDK4_9BILA|nr:hypothetical protein Y032_0044g1054 [Ancylostoma ceylanicum]
MVNERSTGSDAVDVPASAQVIDQSTLNRDLEALHTAPSFQSAVLAVDLDLTQNDSITSKSADLVTANDWDVLTAVLTEAQRISSESMLRTPPEEFDAVDVRTAISSMNGTGERAGETTGLMSTDFSLSSMFPSIFGRGATAQTTRPVTRRDTRSASTRSPSGNAAFRIPEAPKKPKDARRDIVRFRSDYANKFAIGSQHTVNFFSGSYDDAQREAKSLIRLLIVFIHDPNSQDSTRLIHETLNSREFDTFVSNNHLIVWGVASDSEEGKYVAYNLHVYKFPFMSVMCPRADNRMFSVRRITGFVAAKDLVEKLQKAVDVTRSELKELQEQRSKLIADRQIKEQQEREYRESAERDKRKMLAAKKARQEKLEAEEKERRRISDTESRRKAIAAEREKLRLQITKPPVTGEIVNVQIRFPSGAKFSRKFAVDDTLEELFVAIICHEKCPDFFTVASGFPRCQIHCAPEWYHSLLSQQLAADGATPSAFRPAGSFREAGLRRAVAVFVNNCET